MMMVVSATVGFFSRSVIRVIVAFRVARRRISGSIQLSRLSCSLEIRTQRGRIEERSNEYHD